MTSLQDHRAKHRRFAEQAVGEKLLGILAIAALGPAETAIERALCTDPYGYDGKISPDFSETCQSFDADLEGISESKKKEREEPNAPKSDKPAEKTKSGVDKTATGFPLWL
jgi:hypothetical protein